MNPESGKRIRTLIVDDEPHARKSISLLLKDESDIEIIGECSDGSEALDAIKEKSPDLVFLDVKMTEMSGIEALQRLSTKEMPLIIFVTAFDKYAIAAFDFHAVDYLLKPYTDDRFYKALNRAKRLIHKSQYEDVSKRILEAISSITNADTQGNDAETEKKYIRRLLINTPDKVVFVDVDDIDWIAASDYYVEVHTGDKSYLNRKSMKKLEEELDPTKFIRVHRSAIVNIDKIREITKDSEGEQFVVLESGQTLKISRSKRAEVHRAISTA